MMKWPFRASLGSRKAGWWISASLCGLFLFLNLSCSRFPENRKVKLVPPVISISEPLDGAKFPRNGRIDVKFVLDNLDNEFPPGVVACRILGGAVIFDEFPATLTGSSDQKLHYHAEFVKGIAKAGKYQVQAWSITNLPRQLRAANPEISKGVKSDSEKTPIEVVK